jgi:RNA polymerase sigma-70 factor, ECF subfamily
MVAGAARAGLDSGCCGHVPAMVPQLAAADVNTCDFWNFAGCCGEIHVAPMLSVVPQIPVVPQVPVGLRTPVEEPDFGAQLMLRVKAGDGASFGRLVETYHAAMVRFLYRKVQNRALAEELAQDVFLRIYRSRDTYEPTAPFNKWIYQIAARLGSNSRRDRRHERLQESLDDRDDGKPIRQVSDRRRSVEEFLVFQVKLDEVRRAVESLPAKQRAVVQMHKFDEMEYAQIASALNCSVPAVKSLMFRAHETLRTLLEHMAA